MTVTTLRKKLTTKMLVLVLPVLALMAFAIPSAHADDHHRNGNRHGRDIRREGRHFDRHDGRDYRRGREHHRYRRYFRRGGRRYYYYTEDQYYYGPPPAGVSFHIVL